MESNDSTTIDLSRYASKNKNIRSTCMDLFNRGKAVLLRWKYRAGNKRRNVSRNRIEFEIDMKYERHNGFSSFPWLFVMVTDIRSLCAHLHIEDGTRKDGRPQTTVAYDRILDVLSRRDTCLLCWLVSALATRNGDYGPNRDVFLRFNIWPHLSVLMKDASGEKKIAEFRLSFCEESSQPGLTFELSVSEMIDWCVVKKWIGDSPKKDDLDHYPTDFRLIDVENLCVVRAQKPCEYACLSYVWGKDTSYQATLDNIHILEQPNSLGTWDNSEQRSMIEGSDVPATIKDAIVACYALGKRYLWVDRLCILQDEDEENNPSKKEQIHAMGDIYRCAFVTMVALEGTSAAHGLYGVSLNRLQRYRARIGGVVFAEYPWDSLETALGESTWNTRGWTFQEAILSPRLLFFTKHGLWYEHDYMDQIKSDIQEWSLYNTDIHDRNSVQERPQFQWNSGHGFLGYRTAVRMLATRNFSYEWDILHGFSGVINTLFGKDHRSGLPLEYFDFALLWTPWTPSKQRQSRGSAFPSWSWASTMDKRIDYPKYDRLVSVASWVFLDGNEIAEVPCTRNENHQGLEEIELRNILWKQDCMDEPFPRDMHSKRKLGYYAKMLRENWPTRNSFFKGCRGIKREKEGRSKLLEKFDENQITTGRMHGAVLGYSQTTLLTLKSIAIDEFKSKLYHEDEMVGSMVFQFISDRTKAWKKLESGPVEVEVFALSVTWGHGTRFMLREGDDTRCGTLETGLLRPTDSVRPKIVGISSMNVMAIKTSNGISHRMGIGKVYLDKWLRLEKSFKAIVLQ